MTLNVGGGDEHVYVNMQSHVCDSVDVADLNGAYVCLGDAFFPLLFTSFSLSAR